MPALISITKVRLENLPAAAQGTLGAVRVKFRAGPAAAETVPRRVSPDGSVEWLETLVIIVYDLTQPLVAVVSQENSSRGWSLVPGGRFDGALVTELRSDWHGGSSVATDPTLHVQLSVEMEDGLPRDTRLSPQTGVEDSMTRFRPPPTGGSAAGSFDGAYPFAQGGRGGRGGHGAMRMDRAVSGDSSGVVFGGAYGMGAPSGSFGYEDAMGSPEVFVDALSGDGAGAGAGAGAGVWSRGATAGDASIHLSSSSRASSLGGGGLVTAVPVAADAGTVAPSEPPGLRRASTHSASSSSTYGSAPRRPSRKKFAGGWVQSESQDGSFRNSIRMSMSDMGSFSDGSVATAAVEAEEPAPPAPADARLPSPVGKYTPSRLLDPGFQLEDQEEEGKARAEQESREEELSFGAPAFKHASLTEASTGLGSFGSAPLEGRVEEVKTERRPSDDGQGSPGAADGDRSPTEEEPKTWFQKKRKSRGKSLKSRGSGSSGGAASSESAAESSETRSFHGRDGSGRLIAMSVSSTASAAAEEQEESEPRGALPAPRQALTKWKKAGRTTSALQKTFSLLSRKRPSTALRGAAGAAGAAAPPPPPSAPPAAGAPPTKLIEPSELSERRRASHGESMASRPPPTAPPSYQEVLRQRGLLPRSLSSPTATRGAATLYPELATSRSRSSSQDPNAGAAAAAESSVDASVLPPAPSFAAAGSFSPSAPAELGSPRSGWGEDEARPVEPSSVDDEAAAVVAAVTVAEASQQQQQEQQQREQEASGTRADWKDDYVVTTSPQGAAPGAAGAAAPPLPARPFAARTPAARPPARPGAGTPPLSSSATMGDSPESVFFRPGEVARGGYDAFSSPENLYDTGVALGGFLPPPPSASALLGGPSAPDREEEAAVPEQPPVYSAMPADSLDGSGHVDALVDSDSITLYPEVRPRQQLEPAESQTTASSEVTDVEPGFSGNRPRQMVPRQLPPESTSVSSDSTSISGNMSVQGNTRAVPLTASSDGRSGRAPRQRPTSGGCRGYRGSDPVIFSCFAPRTVKPGTAFDLRVKAYLKRHRNAVLRETLSEEAAEAGRPEGMSIARGKRVTVELLLPEDKFKVLPLERAASRPSVSDFVWEGEAIAAKFRVGCLVGIAPGQVKCEALVIEGRKVQRLSFDIEVAGPGYVPRELGSGPNGEVDLDARLKAEEGNVAEVPFEELEHVGELGQGVQGVTSHYRWHGKDVAVKSLLSYPDFYPSTGPTRNDLKHEATILSLLGHHPNVVEFYGVCEQGGSGSDEGIHVITKLEQGGSIEDALGLKRKSNGPSGGGRYAANDGSNGNGRRYGNGYGSEFDGQARAAWARDIACGLANSHSADVLHNDVASRNALLSSRSSESRALLCDFGLSRFLNDGLQKAHLIGTQMDHEKWPILQMPCESLAHPYSLTAKSDSWMFGIFLYELFAGERPWAGLDKHEAMCLVMEGKRPPKVPEMLKDRGTHLVKLYDGCLSKDCEKRPSLEHVVKELSTNYTPMSATW